MEILKEYGFVTNESELMSPDTPVLAAIREAFPHVTSASVASASTTHALFPRRMRKSDICPSIETMICV